MRDRLQRLLSPSLPVSIAAVVIASTGSAVAARAITSKDIKNGTIQLVDLSRGARTALTSAQGARGTKGEPGAAGTQGPSGSTGANGEPGATGAAGPKGDTGATGPAGAAGGGALFASSSEGPAVATTRADGSSDTVAVLPLSGVHTTNGVTADGGLINLEGTSGVGQPVARGGTIRRVVASASLPMAQTPGVTLTAEVWASSPASNIYTPIAGVTLTPLSGTTANGSSSGLSIPVSAQEKLIVVFSATATGSPVANSILAKVSVGVEVA